MRSLLCLIFDECAPGIPRQYQPSSNTPETERKEGILSKKNINKKLISLKLSAQIWFTFKSLGSLPAGGTRRLAVDSCIYRVKTVHAFSLFAS